MGKNVGEYEHKTIRQALEKAEKILIFGGHLIARELYQYLKFHNMQEKVAGFVVSAKENNPSSIEGIPVKQMEEYTEIQNDILILLAVPEKFFSEIREHLHARDYNNIMEIGNFGLAMLENQDVIAYLQKNHPWLEALQDKNEALCVEVKVYQHRMKLMPLAAYPFDESAVKRLKSIKKDRWLYEILFSGTGIPSGPTSVEKQELEVYVVHSPGDLGSIPDNRYRAWERPMLGGAVFLNGESDFHANEIMMEYGDNRGIHISERNREYAEMTAAYWVWKNSAAQFKGISHYRRRYLLDERDIEEIMAGKYDVVTTIPRLVLPDVRTWFSKVSGLSEQDIGLIERAACRLYPDYKKDMERFLSGNILYPNNMVIARAEIYDAYCKWLFSILGIMETEGIYGQLRKKQRYAAYSAELLTSVFLIHHRGRYHKRAVDYRLLFITGD